MKIALLTPDYPPDPGPGEIGLYTRSHARALAALGHEVHVFVGTSGPAQTTLDDGGAVLTRFHGKGPFQRFARRLAAFQLPVLQKRLTGGANALAALRHAVREGGFDVVEVAEHGCEAALLALCLDLPSVVRLHGPAGERGAEASGAMDRLLTRTLERLGIQGAGALTASSRWLLERASARAPLRVPAAVIPAGVDLERFDREAFPDLRARFGIPEDAVKFFCAGMLGDPRSAALLARLVPRTLARWERAVFILAGEDPLQCIPGEILPSLHEGRVAERLFCLGRLAPDQLRACLAQVDVLVHPSTGESCPRLVLWAMAGSCAIVAPALDSGIPEILRAEVDGLLAGGAEGYQAAVDRLAADPGLRRRLGESARRRAESRFSSRQTALRSLEFYRYALGLRKEAVRGAALGPEAPLGPENWFEAWWAARTPRVRPCMARLEDGAPAFAALNLAEIRFVGCVLGRVYWETEAASDSPEAAFLDGLNRLYLERAAALKESGEPEPAAQGGRLRFPPLGHALFEENLAGHFLGETWRISGTEGFRAWLEGAVSGAGFAEEAGARIALRRLAVQAARLAPSRATYGVLRRIYRVPRTHAGIVRQDRDYIAATRADEFEAAVRALGLHTPLERPAVFAGGAAGRPGTAAGPGVVVLIPAYNHARYIGDAIRSVLGQTHPPDRILVVDDRSGDGTAEAARAVGDPRVEVRVNAANMGLGASVCAALEGIGEEFVALLNSDDLFHPRRLELALEAARAEGVQVVATGVSPMDGEGRLLSLAGASAVDHGPMVHEWLRWYEGLLATLDDPGEWSSLDALLRRNHLLTSSNLVCRTEFLRRAAPEICELKYCLDWMLFLLAALERGLAFLPEKLVGYRLHQDNTIWFEQGRRPLFVMEENRVAARALHLLAGRLAAERGPAGAAGELARILTDHLARNGDADGFALFLQEVVSRIGPPGPDAPGMEEFLERIAEFTRRAGERRAVEDVVTELRFPASELHWLAREGGRLLVDRHVAEGHLQRSRDLQKRADWLELEIGDLRRRIEDLWAMRLKAEEQREALRRSAELERGAYESRIASIEGELSSLNQERESLHAARKGLEEELDLLGRMMAEAERTSLARLEALEAEKARLVEELGRLVEELAKLTGALQAEKERYEFARARAEEQARLRARDQEEFRRREEWLHAAWREERYAWVQERQALAAAARPGVGRALLRPFGLDPALNAKRRFSVRAGRIAAEAKALLAAPTSRAFFIVPAEFPAPERPFLAGQAAWLAGRGIAVGFAAWERSGPVRLPGPLAVLFRNRRLQAADRRFFERRAGGTLEALGLPDPGPACTLARGARGARLLLAGAPAAADALGAARLLGRPFCLLAGDRDLAVLRSMEGGARLLLEADLVWAESAAVAEGLAAVARRPASGVVVGPLLPEPAPERVSEECKLVAAAGPVAFEADLETLVEALGDTGLGLEIVGLPEPSARGEEAAYWLRRKIAGRPGGTIWRESADPAELAALFRRADIVFSAGAGADGKGSGTLPASALAALGAGIPVIASRSSRSDPLLRHEAEALLVEPGDAPGLAASLRRLAGDAGLRARLGAAGKARFADLECAAGEVLERLRALIGGAGGPRPGTARPGAQACSREGP